MTENEIFHECTVSVFTYFERLIRELDMEKQRVALGLTTTMGSKYFVGKVLEEWENAIRFLPEGENAQPVLVFKHCIETIHVVARPQKRRSSDDE